RRRTAMEVFLAGEVLPDQRRANNLAILLDQAAVRLIRKHGLGDAGDSQWVDQTGDHRHDDDHHDRGADVFHGCGLLQARPTLVTSRSMSLMPTNGTMMPPTP